MSYHFQIVGLDYVMLALSIYLAFRSLLIKQNEYLRRFCHFSHSVMALEIVNVVLRLKIAGTIHPTNITLYWMYALYFVLMTLAAFEWAVFFEVVRDENYLKDSSRVTLLLAPLLIMVLLCIVSFFNGWLFFIDASSNFQDGPMVAFQYVLPYTYALKVIIGILKLKFGQADGDKKLMGIMFGTLIPIVIGSVIRQIVGGSYVITGCVFGGLVVYIELIVNEIGRLDKFEALGEVNKELEKNLQKTREDFNIIKSMAKAYNASYLINLEDESFKEIAVNLSGVQSVFGKYGNAVEQLEVFCRHVCFQEYQEEMHEFTDLSTLQKRLEGRKYIGKQYEGNLNGWGEAIFIPVDMDESGKLKSVIFATADINNKKILEFEHENMLQMALADAKAANRSKTIFLNNMSHDIRTPLNNIVGLTNLAKNNLDNRELTEKYIDSISDASNHMISLINDILELNRMGNGKLQIMEKEIDLSKFLNGIINMVKTEAEDKGLLFESEVAINNRFVVADSLKLEQILLNILSNAVKFTEKGGKITFLVRQINDSPAGRANYQFTVSDTGVGMTREFVEHIFEAFAKEDNASVAYTQGSGLGMAITKNFVDLLSGDIKVESQPGKGSTFVVELSFATCNGVIEEDEILDMNFSGYKLLLVEDNMLNQEIAKAILEELGFYVDTADDGKEAVDIMEKAQEGQYDAILMDIRMPKLNGYDATRAIREMEGPVAGIPIVAMTANAFEEDRKMAFDAGMNGHLAKPIDIKLLKTTLARVIASR